MTKIVVEVEREILRKKFPHLAREIEDKLSSLSIDAVRTSGCEVEKRPDKFRHHIPTAADYLRRCDSEAQAIETIAYLERKGEITKQYAEELRIQLREKGLRSFGPKKEEDYYLKEAGYL